MGKNRREGYGNGDASMGGMKKEDLEGMERAGEVQ